MMELGVVKDEEEECWMKDGVVVKHRGVARFESLVKMVGWLVPGFTTGRSGF